MQGMGGCASACVTSKELYAWCVLWRERVTCKEPYEWRQGTDAEWEFSAATQAAQGREPFHVSPLVCFCHGWCARAFFVGAIAVDGGGGGGG
eukprot:scaffold228214_cov18-Tisochrysis_lutea.AAC.2